MFKWRQPRPFHLLSTFPNTVVISFTQGMSPPASPIAKRGIPIPDVAIQVALGAYGKILQVKPEVYSNIYTGVRHVLIEIRCHYFLHAKDNSLKSQ